MNSFYNFQPPTPTPSS